MLFPMSDVLGFSRHSPLDADAQREYLAGKIGQLPTNEQVDDFQALIHFLPDVRSQEKIAKRLMTITARFGATIVSADWWSIGLCTRQRSVLLLVRKNERDILFHLFWKKADKQPAGFSVGTRMSNGWVPDASAPGGKRQEVGATTYKEMKNLFRVQLRHAFK